MSAEQVCVAISVCAPTAGRAVGGPHGLHTWEERANAQGEVRSCFPFPPKEIRRNKFGFKKIFLLMKMEKYLNTDFKDIEKFLSLEDKIDHC